jgi:hypothetical protein
MVYCRALPDQEHAFDAFNQSIAQRNNPKRNILTLLLTLIPLFPLFGLFPTCVPTHVPTTTISSQRPHYRQTWQGTDQC